MKISVITAVYKNHTTVAEALDSILAQDHPDIELIVIEGASNDGTLEVIQHYAERIAYLISEPDNGVYDALNKGLHRATGDVVGFLHADDRYSDDRVLSRIAAALADPAVDACYGDLLYVRKENPDQVVRYWVTVRIRAKMSNSGFDYQQAVDFKHKIMVIRTLTKKTIVSPLR